MLYYQYERSYCLTKVVYTAQKMMFSIEDFFSKCDQIRTFTEEILKGKLHYKSLKIKSDGATQNCELFLRYICGNFWYFPLIFMKVSNYRFSVFEEKLIS